MDMTLKDVLELAITFVLGFVSGGLTFSIYKNKTVTKKTIKQNKNTVHGDLIGGDKNEK